MPVDAARFGQFLGILATVLLATSAGCERSGTSPVAPATGSDGLVRELVIGVQEGRDEYLFGSIEAIAATAELTLVLDRSVARVRVYDASGQHVRDIGRSGEGPGEFYNPYLMTISPEGDRVFVRDQQGVDVFTLDGEFVASLHEPGGLILPLVATRDGRILVPTEWTAGGRRRYGLLPVTLDGSRGDPIPAPEWNAAPWQMRASRGGRTRYDTTTYAPAPVWTVAPDGAVLQGDPSRYRFEVRQGADVTVIERPFTPVPVEPAEAQWHRALITERMRQIDPAWSWDANPIPSQKPAFDEFIADNESRVWVRRIAATRSEPDCDLDPTGISGRPPRPCWTDIIVFDGFDRDGTYLGTARILDEVQLSVTPAFVGDNMVAVTEDSKGTRRVARFRIPFLTPEPGS